MRCGDSGHVNSFCLQVATNQDAYKYFLFSFFWAIKQLTGHGKVGVWTLGLQKQAAHDLLPPTWALVKKLFLLTY